MTKQSGFSLVELVIVIAITGVIAGMISVFLLRPVQGYEAQVRRAELVDAAESALRRMQRDIRSALPNSVRIREAVSSLTGDVTCPTTGNICVLEILYAIDGGRYRADPPGGAPERLQFGIVETHFDVMGTLQNFAQVTPATDWVVINNQTTIGTQYNAYFGDNRGLLSAVATTATHINLVGKNFAASLASPRQRFFIVSSPVTFLCDTSAKTLTRYAGYQIRQDHANVDSDTELTTTWGGTSSRLAESVDACRFTYQSGTSERSGMVTLELTIRDQNTGEQVRLLHQVHVDNAP